MRPIYLQRASWLLILLFTTVLATAQNVGINTDGSLPDANAMLDVKSGTKGILIPRMDSNARKTIPNIKGMLVFDISTNSFWFNSGSEWQNLTKAAGWSLSGNSGTTPATHFFGTTDSVPLAIKVNNTPSGFIDPSNTTANTTWGFDAGAMNTTGIFNTSSGFASLHSNNTGNYNSAFGAQTLFSNTNGEHNTSSGYLALYSNTAGSRNTATGANSMYHNNIGIDNTSFGYNSLNANTSGNYNTALGGEALRSNSTAGANTAVGYGAMNFNTTGYSNTAIGYITMNSNQSGVENVAVGSDAMYSNRTGSSNSAFGFQALSSGANTNNNTAIGWHTLFGNNTGNNNTALGYGADVSATNLNNATAIGSGAIVNSSNKVRIGNSIVTVIEGQVPFTTPSDGRFKYNVQENVKGLDFILKLRPVTYQFDVERFDASVTINQNMQASYKEASGIRRTGFIAQEVEKAAIFSGFDFSGIIKPKSDKDHYGLSYESFVVPLVKAVQELNAKVEQLEKELQELKSTQLKKPNN